MNISDKFRSPLILLSLLLPFIHLLLSTIHFYRIFMPGSALAVSGLLCIFLSYSPLMALSFRWHCGDGPLWMLISLIISPLYFILASAPLKYLGFTITPIVFSVLCFSGSLISLYRIRQIPYSLRKLNWPEDKKERFFRGIILAAAVTVSLVILEKPIFSDDYCLWPPDTWQQLDRLEFPRSSENGIPLDIFSGNGWVELQTNLPAAIFSERRAVLELNCSESSLKTQIITLLISNNSPFEAVVDIYSGPSSIGKLTVPARWNAEKTPQGKVTDNNILQLYFPVKQGINSYTLVQKSASPASLEFYNLSSLTFSELRQWFQQKHTVTHWEDAREAILFASSLTQNAMITVPSYDEFSADGGGPLSTEPPLNAILGSMLMSSTDASLDKPGVVGRIACLDMLYLSELFILICCLGALIPSKNLRIMSALYAGILSLSLLNGYHNFSLFPDTLLCILFLGFSRALHLKIKPSVFIISIAMAANQIASIPLIAAALASYILSRHHRIKVSEFRNILLLSLAGISIIALLMIILSFITESLSPSAQIFYKDYDERYTTLINTLFNHADYPFSELLNRLLYFTRLCVFVCPPLVLLFFRGSEKTKYFLYSAVIYLFLIGLSDHFRIHYILPVVVSGYASMAIHRFSSVKILSYLLNIVIFATLAMTLLWWENVEKRDFWNGLPVHTEYVRGQYEGFTEMSPAVRKIHLQ